MFLYKIKNKIGNFLQDTVSYLKGKVKRFLNFERHVIYVGDDRVSSKRISMFFFVWNMFVVIWTFYATVRFFEVVGENAEKEIEISILKEEQQKLLSNIAFLNSHVVNFNKFVSGINRYDRLKTLAKTELFDISKDDLSKSNVRVVLDRVNNNIRNTNSLLADRVDNLRDIKRKIYGDNEDIQPVSFDFENPIHGTNLIGNEIKESIVLKKNFDKNMSELDTLETIINDFPTGTPLVNSRVSDHFGMRIDPFTKVRRMHNGLDLVAPLLSEVSATADGTVIFNGTKGGYGNVVILEHKNKIKTIYAHLSKAVVKEGQKVKRGDAIGVQGTTGRSTGHHLHYEIVRDKSTRLNPEVVLKVGDSL
jgi:murein DD-endopeptidase MepM/ murein hydrolase activator NlpD